LDRLLAAPAPPVEVEAVPGPPTAGGSGAADDVHTTGGVESSGGLPEAGTVETVEGGETRGGALWFGSNPAGAGSGHGGPGWTFGPDAVDAGDAPRPRRRTPTGVGLVARVAGASRTTVAIVVVAAFVLVVLAATHEGPFRGLASGTAQAQSPPPSTRPDVRGTWTALLVYDGAVFRDTVHIATENLSTGAYSGTVASPVGVQTIVGSVTASTISFTIRLNDDVEKGSAALTLDSSLPHFVGTFANSAGGLGTISATRAR